MAAGDNEVRPYQQDLIAGLRLAVIAAVSAVLVAALVIGIGRALLPKEPSGRVQSFDASSGRAP